MKIRILATVCFVLLLPTLTYAAITGVAKTGQSVCYNASGTEIACAGTGQDGDIQVGSAWPSPRFTLNADETVTDNMTGLVWSKDANPVTPVDEKTWQDSLEYIKTLNSGGGYLGYNDWRLPNRNELASLVDSSRINPALPTANPFVNLQTGFVYWSSSTVINFKHEAWAVNMNLGGVDEYGKTGVGHLWPVRGGQSGTLGSLIIYKTGQTLCYNDTGDAIACTGTGQDGEIRAGAAWPNSRFTANNAKQTVTDNITGLVWSKDANPAGAAKTWQEALDYVKTLNVSNHLGYNDWRLPNRNEQACLIDSSQSNPALTALTSVHPFDNVQPYAVYWSSSTYLDSPRNAWSVSMDYGNVSDTVKTGSSLLWPVRGGQSLVISKTGSGTGTVTSSPPWINCGATCSDSFTTGSTAILNSTPTPGSNFTGWSGACTGTGSCTVIMNGAKSVTANFILKGDINNDGSVTLMDAILALQVVSGVTPVASLSKWGDVNSDGKLGMQEGLYILQRIAGLRDGLNMWHSRTPVPSGTSTFFEAIAAGPSGFLIGGQGTIQKSLDGVTWYNSNIGSNSDNFLGLAGAADGALFAAGRFGLVLKSTDVATTWAASKAASSSGFMSIAAGDGKIVAVGYDSSSYKAVIYTSADGGATWSETAPAGINVNSYDGITFGNGKFVVVGYAFNGAAYTAVILTSTDGSTWTAANVNAQAGLRGVTWGGGKFVAVGNYGAILTSPDGSNWAVQNSGITDKHFNHVGYGGGFYVIAGTTGTILSSSDGSAWTSRPSGTTKHLWGVAFGNNTFLVVGGDDTSPIILQSDPLL